MHKLITTLTLTTTLALASVSDAGTRQRSSTPQPSVLSQAERVCEAYGQFAFARAMDRNHGFAMFDILRRSRQWDSANNVEATSRRMHEIIIRGVYGPEGQQLSPIGLRQLTEVACIEGRERPTTATMTKDRY